MLKRGKYSVRGSGRGGDCRGGGSSGGGREAGRQGVRTLIRGATTSGSILANRWKKRKKNRLSNGLFSMCVLSLTFQFHARFETLVESAGRTLFPGGDGDWALSAPQTHVVLLVLDGPLEETLARLAGENAVVESGDLVTAHGTRTRK